jgi:recombination protein RecA
METKEIKIMRSSYDELRELVKKKWPESLQTASTVSDRTFSTGIDAFDSLFPGNGIPHGQLVEITGSLSSGKTSFLFTILATLTRTRMVAYLDFSNSFFPSAAESSGIDLGKILIVKSNDIREGLRAAELILRHEIAGCIVFDLVRSRGILPLAMMHRLRQKTLKAGSIIIFLTENNSEIIPTSMIALRIEIERIENSRFAATVTKSRISKEGFRVEIAA